MGDTSSLWNKILHQDLYTSKFQNFFKTWRLLSQTKLLLRRNMAFPFCFSCSVHHAIVCFLIILRHTIWTPTESSRDAEAPDLLPEADVSNSDLCEHEDAAAIASSSDNEFQEELPSTSHSQPSTSQQPIPSGCLACPGLTRRSSSWAPQFAAGVKWLKKKQKSSRTLKLQHPGVKLDGALQTSTHWTMLLEIWTVPCVRTLDVYSSLRSQRRNMAFLFHFICSVQHAIVCFLIILCHLVLGQSIFTTHSKWTTNLFFFWERLVWVMRPWTNFVPCLASSLWTRLYIRKKQNRIIDVMVESADTILCETVAFLFRFSCSVHHAIVCFLIILCHLVLGQSMFITRSTWTTDLFFFWERFVWVMRPWTNVVPCLASSLWTRLYIRKKPEQDHWCDGRECRHNPVWNCGSSRWGIHWNWCWFQWQHNYQLRQVMAQVWPYIKLWLWCCDWCPDPLQWQHNWQLWRVMAQVWPSIQLWLWCCDGCPDRSCCRLRSWASTAVLAHGMQQYWGKTVQHFQMEGKPYRLLCQLHWFLECHGGWNGKASVV